MDTSGIGNTFLRKFDEPATIRFEKRCLSCGRVLNTHAYNCECNEQQWQNQYRALDLQLYFDEEGRRKIIDSFKNYSLESEAGMLQYEALPNHDLGEGTLRVGNTPLYRLRNFSARLGLSLFAKSEGHNPSGCFKDRETLMCLLNARNRQLSKAVIYSSGNAAGSAAIFAQRNQHHLITFVSGDTYREKIDFIRSHGSDVVVIGGEETNFETGYRIFSKINSVGFYARLGYDNWSIRNPYRVEGDKTTAVEIIKQMSGAGEKPTVPDFVIVPTANGSCLAGMWKGFRELYNLGVIDRLPKMISVGINQANPVYKAVKTRTLDKPSVADLSQMDPSDADIGSIIIAEEGYDSIQAARAVVESGGVAVEVGKSDIEETLRMLLEEEREFCTRENILPEPASLISIAAVNQVRTELDLQPQHRVVSVITGSGVKSISKIRELLPDDAEMKALVERIYQHQKKKQYPAAAQQGREISVPPTVEAVTGAFNELKR